jgi:hypothetical protein
VEIRQRARGEMGLTVGECEARIRGERRLGKGPRAGASHGPRLVALEQPVEWQRSARQLFVTALWGANYSLCPNYLSVSKKR